MNTLKQFKKETMKDWSWWDKFTYAIEYRWASFWLWIKIKINNSIK